jgi:hypothetical protein
MIKLIGYWRPTVPDPYWIDPNSAEWAYPDPKDLINEAFWTSIGHDKTKVINYLKNGSPCNHYRGYSDCRICGEGLSSHERSDGVWCWPDKLEHYLEEHNVILPEEFVAHAEISEPLKLEFSNKDGVEKDMSFWKSWSLPYRKPTPVPMSPEEYLKTKR